MGRSFLNMTDLARGIRNNNPGNLVLTTINWKGKVPRSQNTDGHFEQFISLDYGIRAMMTDLVNDWRKRGRGSLTELISEYAPQKENDTQGYIQQVAQGTGLDPNKPIEWNEDLLIKMVKTMIRIENGTDAGLVLLEDIQSAVDMLPSHIRGIIGKKKRKSPDGDSH